MKKILVTVMLCVAMLTNLVAMAAYESETFTDIEYYVNYNNKTIELSGNTILPNARLGIVVLNQGRSLEEVETDGAALQNICEVMTTEFGSFEKSIPLSFETEPDETIIFPVYAKLIGNQVEQIAGVEYKSRTDRDLLLKKLQGSKEDIEALLNDAESLSSMEGIDNLDILDKVDLAQLAASMQGHFNSFDASAESFSKACDYMKEFCVLELFNQNSRTEVFDEQGNYLTEDYLSLEKHDNENKTSFYEFYQELITYEGKEEIIKNLMGKDIDSPENLFKTFAVNTVLTGLTKPKSTGYGHVEKLLTTENCDYLEIKIDKALDGDAEAKIAAHSGFDSIKALEDFIDEIQSEPSSSDDALSNNRNNNKVGSISVEKDAFVTKEQETKVFNDISDSHWAVEAIAYLKAKGVIDGVGENIFEPDSLLTREQLVKMILAIAEINVTDNSSAKFNDVSESSWCAPYISAAVDAGIINGISNTEFGYGLNATRQDICTVVQRILKIDEFSECSYADSDLISEYAYSAVCALSSKKIVNGYPDGTFAPNAYCTRAEVAAILYRAAKFLEVNR